MNGCEYSPLEERARVVKFLFAQAERRESCPAIARGDCKHGCETRGLELRRVAVLVERAEHWQPDVLGLGVHWTAGE